MASGVNRYFAAPDSMSTGTKTMQMHNVETKAGTAISCAPSRIARTSVLPLIPMLRWTFSISTVASSTRIPTARAKPPSVITLMVCPRSPRMVSEVRIESGIEMQTISVLRQLPRNSRIMSAVSNAAMLASRTTPCTAARTNSDWSKSWVIFKAGGRVACILGRRSLTPCTTANVDAPPCRNTVSSDERPPLMRTMLV